MMISGENLKAIRKELGLSPNDWWGLEQQNHKLKRDRYKIECFVCKCNSCWCKDCAHRSDTHELIREKMKKLKHDLVRHVILTVNPVHDPVAVFLEVRSKRAIPKFIRRLRLKTNRWLWILEFHASGHPHWHLLIENHGMIGKHRIEKAWPYGLVWESYVHNADHWLRLIGYHQGKGYLAGEKKAHQLELPAQLMQEKSVRKFGYGAGLRSEADSRPLLADQKRKHANGEKKTIAERLSGCNKVSKLRLNESVFAEIPAPASVVKAILGDIGDRIDYKTWNVPDYCTAEVIAAIEEHFDCALTSNRPPKSVRHLADENLQFPHRSGTQDGIGQ